MAGCTRLFSFSAVLFWAFVFQILTCLCIRFCLRRPGTVVLPRWKLQGLKICCFVLYLTLWAVARSHLEDCLSFCLCSRVLHWVFVMVCTLMCLGLVSCPGSLRFSVQILLWCLALGLPSWFLWFFSWFDLSSILTLDHTLLDRNLDITRNRFSVLLPSVYVGSEVLRARQSPRHRTHPRSHRRGCPFSRQSWKSINHKDHKPNFQKNTKCRLINPAKPQLGIASSQILQKINGSVRN